MDGIITWGETIDIICETFRINQNELADLLGITKYKISKVKNGHEDLKIAPKIIYSWVFDPKTKKSPAKETEKESLVTLEETISSYGKFKRVKEIMSDHWVNTENCKDSDYEPFVMKLLSRTRYIPLPKDEDKTATPDSDIKNAPAPKRMVDTFYQAINDYPVEDFMERNPVDSLSSDRIRDVISFVGHIRYKSQEEDIPDKNEDIYQEILQFTDSLLEYLRFLKINSAMPDNFPEGYQPPRDDNEFVKTADHHRQQLKSLYQALQEKVDKIMDEEYEQRRKEHKRSWDENTHKGIL